MASKIITFFPEVVAQIWLDPIRGFWGCWKTFIKHFFQYINSFMPFLASEGCFWPLTASITLEVKNDHAYVITQGICNKFIEVNFCVGCMVSQPNRLFQRLTTMSLIKKKVLKENVVSQMLRFFIDPSKVRIPVKWFCKKSINVKSFNRCFHN